MHALPEEDVAAWAAARPDGAAGDFDVDAQAVSAYLRRGEQLLHRLPELSRRSEHERAAAAELHAALDGARERFLRAHAERLHADLSDGRRRPLRVEELVDGAAERVPGLVPGAADLAVERERALPDKEGLEAAHGLLLCHVLAAPAAGAHLVWSMLRPTPAALVRLDELRATGAADLGAVHLRREGRAAHLELRNPRHLNAEDGKTLAATEIAVDLALLDPAVEVGVLRGGVVDHQRYRGRRIFGAGINLTHLYRGRIDFLFYVVRDLGYVNKLFRGLSAAEHRPGEPEETTEKPWIAAVETYAIGGACQLLHVVDHVIAERAARMYLPARREGIIPGASNLRLPRAIGERLARQAIFSGREFEAGSAEGDLLCDEVVEPGTVDAAIRERVEALTSSGLVNAAANRRAMRAGVEPLELFRAYMAAYCRDQARCHFSPALVRNLEDHWNARERRP